MIAILTQSFKNINLQSLITVYLHHSGGTDCKRIDFWKHMAKLESRR